jgi:hypothetical protein
MRALRHAHSRWTYTLWMTVAFAVVELVRMAAS